MYLSTNSKLKSALLHQRWAPFNRYNYKTISNDNIKLNDDVVMAACLQYRNSMPAHHFIKTSRVWCNPRTIKRRHISQIPTRFSSNQMNQSTESTVGTTDQIVEKSDDGGDVLYQYVVLRRDLIDTWPLGCVVTQGCHASVSAIWMNKDDSHTVEYCSPSKIDSMHKVTLEVKGETQILNLSEKLKAGGISHKLWIEEPENIPTCLATKPYPKSMLILSRNEDSTFGEKGVAFSHIYILFQNTIVHTISKPSRILYGCTFVATIIECTRTRYETNSNKLL